MRQLLSSMLATIAVLLPGPITAQQESAEETMNVKRAFAERYTDAWNSGQPEAVAAFFAEDGSLQVNDAEPAVGRAAIADVARGFMEAFPDMELFMDELEFVGGGARYHWTFVGINTGPGGTGNAVRFSGYEEWTFSADGLVQVSLGHFDEAEYARQLAEGVGAS